MPDLDSAMIPARRAAEIAGISPQRLWYWENTRLIEPTVRKVLTVRNIVRLYSFDRLVELVVAASLVAQPGITLQHLRKVLEHLRSQQEYEAPLRELRFAVRGREVFFQHADGSWEGSRKHWQLVAHQVVDLQEIHHTLRERLARSGSDAGRVERRRRAYGSKPVFAGTRVPVSAVESFIRAGRTDEEILDAYPDLAIDDVRPLRKRAAVS